MSVYRVYTTGFTEGYLERERETERDRDAWPPSCVDGRRGRLMPKPPICDFPGCCARDARSVAERDA